LGTKELLERRLGRIRIQSVPITTRRHLGNEELRVADRLVRRWNRDPVHGPLPRKTLSRPFPHTFKVLSHLCQGIYHFPNTLIVPRKARAAGSYSGGAKPRMFGSGWAGGGMIGERRLSHVDRGSWNGRRSRKFRKNQNIRMKEGEKHHR